MATKPRFTKRELEVIALAKENDGWRVRRDGAIRNRRGCCPIEAAARTGPGRLPLANVRLRLGWGYKTPSSRIVNAADRRGDPMRPKLLKLLGIADAA